MPVASRRASPADVAAAPAPAAAGPLRAPSLPRRLACFVYEGVLLFGVVMIAGWLFSTLSQQRHALQGRGLLQGFLFLVFAVYFTWFWSHGGQTLAMKTWRVRLVTASGGPLTQAPYRLSLKPAMSSWPSVEIQMRPFGSKATLSGAATQPLALTGPP